MEQPAVEPEVDLQPVVEEPVLHQQPVIEETKQNSIMSRWESWKAKRIAKRNMEEPVNENTKAM